MNKVAASTDMCTYTKREGESERKEVGGQVEASHANVSVNKNIKLAEDKTNLSLKLR